MSAQWKLHHEPHRHYKMQADSGKWTWNGRDKTRIASVTDVLSGSDNLTDWATARTLVAAEQAAVHWLDAAPALATSVLDFAAMAQLTGLMPNSIRDDKGAIGTAAHTYLGTRLAMPGYLVAREAAAEGLPYGYRCAIDRFLDETGFAALEDDRGLRVERAVGSEQLAVAGTYDAQGYATYAGQLHLGRGTHRIDLKSSNSVQPKFFAQLAAYEYLAQECGEEPSDYLTIIHITPLGGWTPYSIKVVSPERVTALDLFRDYLGLHRRTRRLAKLLKTPQEDN